MYYKRFIDLSRYDPETAANPAEMLRRFKLGAKKKWRTLATILPFETYQEFYKIMLRIEDSKNMSSGDEEEEARGSNQMRHDRGKRQLSQGHGRPRVLRRVGIVLALLVRASVPRDRGEEVGLLEDPASRGLESQLVQVHRCAIGAITNILESVEEAVADAIHVDRQDICLSFAHKDSIHHNSHSSHSRYNSFPCHHRFRLSSIHDLVVMLQQVMEVHTTIKGIIFLIL